jgi:ATP-dependent DNA helicase DinG
MKCKCGYETPAELAAQNEGRCASCGDAADWEPIELLSRPALGLIEELRPGQVEYARSFDEMLYSKGNECGMFQAGCGVGKTFAYGLPAILSHKRIIIATGKKSLQDQLANKDLPFLQQFFGEPPRFTFASMKGRSNYVCRRLLEKHEGLFRSQNQERLHRELTEWALRQDHVGDLDTFPGELVFPATLCTADDCTKCGYGTKGQCGFRRRKAEVRAAQVAIVNHSLLGYDLRFGPGKILGPYGVLIVDEAHVAPGFIRNAFSQDLSETWLRHVIDRLHREQITMHLSITAQRAIEDLWTVMFADLPKGPVLPAGVLGQKGTNAAAAVHGIMRRLERYVRHRWGEENWDELELDLMDRAKQRGENEALQDFRFVKAQYLKLDEKRQTIVDTATADDNWVISHSESNSGRSRILRQPVNLGPLVGPRFAAVEKLLFTSATLNDESLAVELGVRPTRTVSVPSPFPYNRSLVYVPKHLPRPDDPKWHDAVAQECVELMRASRGNALVLFSSLHDLREIRRIVDTEYEFEYPLLAQGDGRRPTEVFAEFMRTEHAVLFGSKSFFEGIDVRGEKLSLVIIPKLPFPSPEDPLTKAKSERLGKSWFSGWSYPQMLQDVQQAAGRLVRTRDDRGVVAILDVRIWVGGNREVDPQDIGTKKLWRGYGYQLIQALPFPNWSPRRELVFEYFKALKSAA